MSRLRALLVVALLIHSTSLPMRREQAEEPPISPDETAVRTLYSELLAAWNGGRAAAFASMFSETADLITPNGFRLKGRDRIASFHEMLFSGVLNGVGLTGTITGIRFLTHDAAIVHAIGRPTRSGHSSDALQGRSVQMLLTLKRDGTWRVETFQNTPI